MRGGARAGFQISAARGQSQPVMNEVLVEANLFASSGLDQRAADQQRVLQHELQCGIRVELFGNDFAGLYTRGGAVEPFRDGALPEEGEQPLLRPWLGQQIARDDFMTCGGKQCLLFGVVAATGFFVEGDLCHWGNV